jgi:hypothetical protein
MLYNFATELGNFGYSDLLGLTCLSLSPIIVVMGNDHGTRRLFKGKTFGEPSLKPTTLVKLPLISLIQFHN